MYPTGNRGGGRPSSTTGLITFEAAELPELPDVTILALGGPFATGFVAEGLEASALALSASLGLSLGNVGVLLPMVRRPNFVSLSSADQRPIAGIRPKECESMEKQPSEY